MFVFSFKHNRKKTVAVLAVLLVAVTAVIVLVSLHNASPQAVSSGKKYSLSASTNEERVAFFQAVRLERECRADRFRRSGGSGKIQRRLFRL
jgi:3-deoxy-D-arabino-heptulosonate 7-phosphate (DAHP) synthase